MLRKRYYILFVARDEDGRIRKIPLPLRFAYGFVAAALVGAFTIVGLAGSYTRMLLKTENFNQMRLDRENLRKNYKQMEQIAHDRDVQVASLGALASEVTALYGLRQNKLAVTAAAASAAAAPTPSAHRGLACSAIQPISGPPTGVVPRNATAHNAMTRPRICGAAVICSVALPTERNQTLAAPTSSSEAAAVCTVGEIAVRAVDRPNAADDSTSGWMPVARRLALTSPPTTAPTPMADVIAPRLVAPSPNVSVTSAGNDTWNS